MHIYNSEEEYIKKIKKPENYEEYEYGCIYDVTTEEEWKNVDSIINKICQDAKEAEENGDDKRKKHILKSIDYFVGRWDRL